MSTSSDALNPADADARAVLAALQAQDQLLTQGTIIYQRRGWSAPGEFDFASVPDEMAMADEFDPVPSADEPGDGSEAARGTREAAFEREMRRQAREAGNAVTDCELTFTKEGHFWLRTTEIDPGTGETLPLLDPETGATIALSSATVIYDGRDHRIIIGNQVILASSRPEDLEEDSRPITLYPGPCFMLGRGLSLLQDISLERRDGQWYLVGSLGDETYIEAELEAAYPYLARHIARKEADGTLIGTTVLDTPLNMGSCSIASHAVHSVVHGEEATPSHRDEYFVRRAEPQPRAVEFSPPLKKGTFVIDDRLEHPVGLDLEIDQTPTQILPQSQKQLQDEAALRARRPGDGGTSPGSCPLN